MDARGTPRGGLGWNGSHYPCWPIAGLSVGDVGLLEHAPALSPSDVGYPTTGMRATFLVLKAVPTGCGSLILPRPRRTDIRQAERWSASRPRHHVAAPDHQHRFHPVRGPRGRAGAVQSQRWGLGLWRLVVPVAKQQAARWAACLRVKRGAPMQRATIWAARLFPSWGQDRRLSSGAPQRRSCGPGSSGGPDRRG